MCNFWLWWLCFYPSNILQGCQQSHPNNLWQWLWSGVSDRHHFPTDRKKRVLVHFVAQGCCFWDIKKCAEDRGWVGGVWNSTYLRDIIFVQWCECFGFTLNPTEEVWSVKCTAKELRRSTQKLDLCIFSATILFHLLPGQITMVTCFCCLQGKFCSM